VDTTKENTITHLSLCTGYEGIGKGLRRVLPNVREIAYVEIEAFAIANLVNKMETQQLDAAPIYTNLKEFPYAEFRGQVDILSGGFPCQPFSQAGARKATEDPRHLFPYIAEGIRECQPRIVFLENVEGIISAKTTDGESVLRYVLRTLEGLGYKATAGIFSASEVGFPHQRKRVFILGVSDTIKTMVDSNWSGHRENAGRDGETQEVQREHRSQVCGGMSNGASEELGYSEGTRQSSSDDRSRQAQLGGTSSRNAQSELSDTDIERLEGSVLKGEPREQTKESSSGCSWGKYPARPNEEQYEWEAPRVVEAKPRLGGATNGSSNRVDRLRLLGNGVVPQTAAKAFETLIKRVL